MRKKKKKAKKRRANNRNKKGFCSYDTCHPEENVSLGFPEGKEPEACFCWWGDGAYILENYD